MAKTPLRGLGELALAKLAGYVLTRRYGVSGGGRGACVYRGNGRAILCVGGGAYQG